MRAPFAIFGATIVAVAVAACGARSELRVPPPHHHVDASDEDVVDAGPDVEDAPPDAPPDVEDAPPDAPPPVDCQDAGITYVYLITGQNILARFYPPSGVIEQIGTIDCPDDGNPFSMAVDRSGVAWVLFTTGNLYRVSTATASCKATPFVVGQQGFSQTFGMGYSANVSDMGETLYVASSNADTDAGVNGSLATIDATTFTLGQIGTFTEQIGDAELTGTKDGRLYAFGIQNVGNPAISLIHLAQIDKTNASVIGDQFINLPSGNSQVFDWAFAFWGGDFYFFTSTDNASSVVSRYTPGDPTNTAQPVAMFGSPIVGAGVSTCAPVQ